MGDATTAAIQPASALVKLRIIGRRSHVTRIMSAARIGAGKRLTTDLVAPLSVDTITVPVGGIVCAVAV
jgi:hypothetical protein